MRRITVFHNIACDAQGRSLGMLDGYTPGHPLVPVLQWDSFDSRTDSERLEHLFREFNVGDSEIAVKYRARNNRSLSVGDAVAISTIGTTGGVVSTAFWVVAKYGWSEDARPPFYVWASQHGTTALDPEQVKPWLP